MKMLTFKKLEKVKLNIKNSILRVYGYSGIPILTIYAPFGLRVERYFREDNDWYRVSFPEDAAKNSKFRTLDAALEHFMANTKYSQLVDLFDQI